MSFFGKSRKEEERELLFRQLKEAAADAYETKASTALMNVQARGLQSDPELPFLVDAVITAMAEHRLADGFSMALFVLNTFDDKELVKSVSNKTLSLIDRVDRDDLALMATAAEAAGVVVWKTPPGSEERQAGRAAWLSVVDEMASKQEGLRYVFAAAASATRSAERPPLLDDAVEKWDSAVMTMAKTNRRAAITEAMKVQYDMSYAGEGVEALRNRAVKVLDRLNKMKP